MSICYYRKAIYTERVHGALHMLRAAVIVVLIGLLPSQARAEEPIVTPMPERQPTRCEHIEAQVGNENRCLKPKDSFRDCPDCPEMVVVPPGKSTMGSPENEKDRLEDEGPQHEVTIARPFAVGKTDVTFAEWDVCIAAGACPKVFDNGLAWAWGDQPVILVSWDEAKGYAAWLKRMTGKDYRLLSETEWEYAARAGNQGRWSFGDDELQVHDYT
jgi:formylglycine-generating enzyme required for sulfatase activity